MPFPSSWPFSQSTGKTHLPMCWFPLPQDKGQENTLLHIAKEEPKEENYEDDDTIPFPLSWPPPKTTTEIQSSLPQYPLPANEGQETILQHKPQAEPKEELGEEIYDDEGWSLADEILGQVDNHTLINDRGDENGHMLIEDALRMFCGEDPEDNLPNFRLERRIPISQDPEYNSTV